MVSFGGLNLCFQTEGRLPGLKQTTETIIQNNHFIKNSESHKYLLNICHWPLGNTPVCVLIV